jgi:hypothetical protein
MPPARPSTSADITDGDPPVAVDIDMSSSDEPMDIDASDGLLVASTVVDHTSSEELSVRELWEARWKTSNTRFKNMFTNIEFGLECSACDRLRFDRDLTKSSNKHVEVSRSHFSDDLDTLKESRLCVTCKQSLNRGKLPTISKTNGFIYPPKPCGL